MRLLDEDVSTLKGMADNQTLPIGSKERETLRRVADILFEREHAVTWHTTCVNCAKLFDQIVVLDLAIRAFFDDNPEFRRDARFADLLKVIRDGG
jgi:hypothetical protein